MALVTYHVDTPKCVVLLDYLPKSLTVCLIYAIVREVHMHQVLVITCFTHFKPNAAFVVNT